jgi:hypothetical protein
MTIKLFKYAIEGIVALSLLGLSGCNSGDDSINNTPSIGTNFADIVLQENNGTTNYEINVSDIDGDSLTLSIESNNTSILTVTQNYTNPLSQGNYSDVTLDFNLTTEVNATGLVQVTITVDDGEVNSTKNFDVNIAIIVHNSVGYNTVISPYTGKVWLDRNLGASQTCTALDDTACYGDYYQWGRNTDGHEKLTSVTTVTQATDINSAGTDFITSDSTYSYDWAQSADSDGSLRIFNWSKTDGTSVCPVGYRVPTITELAAETVDQGEANNTDAFNNFLKLPSSGTRGISSGTMYYQGSSGYVWSASPFSPFAQFLGFNFSNAYTSFDYCANGRSIRCLKD